RCQQIVFSKRTRLCPPQPALHCAPSPILLQFWAFFGHGASGRLEGVGSSMNGDPMQKLTEDFNRHLETHTPLKAQVPVRVRHWLDQAEAVGASHPAITTLVGLAWVTSIGLLNLTLAGTIRFDFFYLLGCVAVGWVAGIRGSLLVAVVSGFFLYLAELPQPA